MTRLPRLLMNHLLTMLRMLQAITFASATYHSGYAALLTQFSTFPPAHTRFQLHHRSTLENWGVCCGGSSRVPIIQIYPNIPTPPHCDSWRAKRATRCPSSSTCRIWWTWKMMCTGERPTPREDRLARCSPCRGCVLRVKHVSVGRQVVALVLLSCNVPILETMRPYLSHA